MSDEALFAGDRFYRSQFDTGQATNIIQATYHIFQNNGVVYADPGVFGGTPYSGSDAATVINNALAALPSTGGSVFIKAGIYNCNSGIAISKKTQIRAEKGVRLLYANLTGTYNLIEITAEATLDGLEIDGNQASVARGTYTGSPSNTDI